MLKIANLPVRMNSSRMILFQAKTFTSLQPSLQLEEENIEDIIDSNLAHGKVTIWTRGDDCIHSGKQSRRVKKLLTKSNIEFQENIINDSSEQQIISYCLLMHTGYGNFPNIYFGEEHIGGLDDLKAYLQDSSEASRIIDQNGISLTSTTDEETQSQQSNSEYRCFEKMAI